MKKLVLNLTDAQFRRFEIVGALLSAKPEHVVVALALSELDSYWGSDWQESEEFFHSVVAYYGEGRRAFQRGQRSTPVEKTAPERRLRIVTAKEVRHA